jgi:hypothetical protein
VVAFCCVIDTTPPAAFLPCRFQFLVKWTGFGRLLGEYEKATAALEKGWSQLLVYDHNTKLPLEEARAALAEQQRQNPNQ